MENAKALEMWKRRQCVSRVLELANAVGQQKGRALQILQVLHLYREQIQVLLGDIHKICKDPERARVDEVRGIPQGPSECHILSAVHDYDFSI